MRFPRSSIVAGVLLTLAGAVAAAPASAAAPAEGTVLHAAHADALPGRYIVVLGDSAGAAATDVAARFGARVTRTYTTALRGFAVEADAKTARLMAGDPRVAYVAQDVRVDLDPTAAEPVAAPGGAGTQALAVQTDPPSWGLDRIDERSLPMDDKYHYPNTATHVRAYVIGTGIRYGHQEFEHRAIPGIDTVGGISPPGYDCNGHGTHMAGTIGGHTVGIAKKVTLVSVRVLNCGGSGSFSGVLAGIDWLVQDAAGSSYRSVANLTLGGGHYQPLNDAVTAAINANVHFSVVSGSSNSNACNYSPGSTPAATTVGATTSTDTRASFSNYGPCIDLWAPGVDIYSAWGTSDSAYATISGSTAAAHATGVAALWRMRFPTDNAIRVAGALVANATPGVVGSPGTGSPNLLLHMGMIPV